DNTAEETSVYYEGELFDVFSGAINTGVDDLELGRYNNQEFEGFMDEFRISSVARSSEWIKTEFNNQSDPSSFFSSDISESNIVWTGANDTDWNDIGNWSSCFLPTPGDDVIIPGGLMNYPLLDQDRTVGFLSIGAGADVALGTFELTALGDISNSGTLTANTGSVRMAGSVDQYIRGASATTFHDLVVDKGSGELILDQDVIVDNDLTFAQGFVRLNGRELIIGSSGQINGADMSRFFISDENSCLTQRGLGTGSRTGDILFPIGTAVTSYTPVTLNNMGTADDFCVFVCDQVFEEGTCSGTLIDMGVVDKTWNVTPVNGLGLDVTLQLQWNGTDEGAGFDRLDAPFISRHSGTQWNARASGPLGGTDPYTLSTSGLSNFSPFAIGSGSSLLPVEYSALRAYAAEDEVVLEWSTASEENNDRFLIERSSGQDDFVVIGEVQGAGDAQTTQDYLFRDEAPMPGLNLYRLRQIDFDGGFELSRVLVVHFVPNTEGSILLYPNPALDRVTVDRSEVPTGLVELHVVDMTGRLMLERVLKDSQATSLDFSTWRRGQYVFIFKGATYEQRFLFVLR
ncbi:MAG: T9SS type A sorting domain-containing protein, partial [Bacteroidota bacterium]